MNKRVNCIHCKDLYYCKNENVKRSFFGIGARHCVEMYEGCNICEFKELTPRPKAPPSQARPSSKLPQDNSFCYVAKYKFMPYNDFTIKLFRSSEKAQAFKQKCKDNNTLCSLMILDFED